MEDMAGKLKLKKPHLEKISEIAGFSVWIVDGSYIRERYDHDFTNFGQHYRFKFIPKNEFWIDNGCDDGEKRYYIDHLLIEHWLMSRGMPYAEALEKADLIEKRERNKALLLKGVTRKETGKKIHKRLLKKYSKSVAVWIVDGEIVRTLFNIDFTEGGHDKVYHFIPAREVWVDDDLEADQRKYVILHELHERQLMAKGVEYEKAHDSANEIEYYCKRNPEELERRLKQEIARNK